MISDATQKHQSKPPSPEYLVIGHVTSDLINSTTRIGGTVTFSGLTARSLGMQAGIVTSFSEEFDISPLDELQIWRKPSSKTTTFKNISEDSGRTQFLFQKAEPLTSNDLPNFFVPPLIVHLGPVADEVDPDILKSLTESLKCLTPQGWFRQARSDGRVVYKEWEDFDTYLNLADIAVISLEDVDHNETTIAKMAQSLPILVVTEAQRGARVYWYNDARFIKAPEVEYVSDTGAGDIFATAFFYRYLFTKDPWEAGRFAVVLASSSVTREYLKSIPKPGEIEKARMEVIGH